eukprot:1903992-Pyramimonas_sp.AAC.1
MCIRDSYWVIAWQVSGLLGPRGRLGTCLEQYSVAGEPEDLRGFARKPETMMRLAARLPDRVRDAVADMVTLLKSQIKEKHDYDEQCETAMSIPDLHLLTEMTGWPLLCSDEPLVTDKSHKKNKPTTAAKPESDAKPESRKQDQELFEASFVDEGATPTAKADAKLHAPMDEAALDAAAVDFAKSIPKQADGDT